MLKLLARLFGVLVAVISSYSLAAEIPKSLEEWKPWVLEKHPELNCPFQFNTGNRTCHWYSGLTIEANDKGAKFTQRIDVYKSDWVALPGSASLWPHNISSSLGNITTRDRNGTPEAYLTPGSHQITGNLSWAEMPRTISIPAQTGLIQLTLNGKSVNNPALEGNNQLWLANNQPKSVAAHQDALSVRVFRKIDDGIPLQITTQLQLGVSGKEREIKLGQLLLDGFTVVEFESELPAHIEKDGSLRVQLKPGTWEITLVSTSTTSHKDISYKVTNEFWPQEEIWVFEAQRQLRSVQISGAQSVDPQQTQLPDDWKNLPAYLVTPQTHFTLEELYRGENKDVASNLQLERNAWLGFDGKGFIFNDTLNGEIYSSRIEMIKPVELTSAKIDGEPQLVTQLDKNQNSGLEIRSRNLSLQAVSKLERSLTLPVSGWNQELNNLHTTLFLPPGWSLFTATGTSNEIGTWLSKWTLWDMFAVLIIAVAFARITSIQLGVLAGLGLIVVYQRLGAPVFIWLNLIAVIALTTLVTGKFKTWLVRYGYLSFLSLAIITLPFAVREARIMINPSLENKNFWVVSTSSIFSSREEYAPLSMKTVEAPSPEVAEEVVVARVTESMAAAPAPKRADVDSIEAEDFGKFPDSNVAESLQRIPGVKTDRRFDKKYDPSQQTQTGIAVPTHDQKSVNLYWDGPIKQDETTKLFLISPWFNKLGNLLAILLPLLMAVVLLKKFLSSNDAKLPSLKFPGSRVLGLASCLMVGSSILFTPDSAQADVTIDPSILKELEARLTEQPKCLPHCAAIERVNIDIKQDQLTLDLVVNANDLIAFPLPADHQQWWPNQVTVDGKPAALVQAADQSLLVSLPKGQHNLRISANVQGHDALNLQFPLPLHNVTPTTSGWELSGLPNAEQSSQSLQLQRVERDQSASQTEHLRPDPIAAFVLVKRTLKLDLDWTLVTTVTRVAPAVGTINIEVPILNGESPLTTKANPNGKVAVHLESDDDEFEWSSNLKEISPIKLQAAQNVPWVEIWTLDISPRWHSQTTGIAPIQMAKHENIPVWQPWPGESLTIDVHRPQATQGQHITVDEASLSHNPGNHNSLSILNLNIRSNQGGQYTFTLPEGAQLSKLEIDNTEQLISSTKGVLKVPLHPGSQKVSINWKQDDAIGLLTKTPLFNLENGSSNQNISMGIPYNRWVLWVGGPQIGPSILLWGMLVVMAIVAYGLGRAQLTPLKPYEWILLSLGICTLNMGTFIWFAVWLLALSQRGKLSAIGSKWKFRFLQLGLFALSLFVFFALVTTLPDGLLSSPDMHIVGHNTYGNNFYWYQDHSDLAFPTAWVISLPLWCYKVIILIWSLWFAASLLKWLRWAWQQLSYRGLWDADADIIPAPKLETKASDESTKEV
ncbi:hypothetical protein GCM10011613_08180 [Cellvibrio zantedeschiae]|uniref:Uncharacterized protein n=1 Tax=Cellvibrio zantedeschiae TaxID=1237077 RepID=A0ABQ3AT68_9GAMM|nr:hypothetical protein [Cellvibrio zantedeschiae]GGY66580.1 hypothetical protein GCM10011613_08180 [Cellvibrio zantedeschiae]